ncbi:hypothetical protein D3C71_1691980 [compost metagenome]
MNTGYLPLISDEIMQTEGHKTLNGKATIKAIELLSSLGFIRKFKTVNFDKEISIQTHQKLCLLAILVGKNTIDDFIKFYRFTPIVKIKYEELYKAYHQEERVENRLRHQVITIKKIIEEKE